MNRYLSLAITGIMSFAAFGAQYCYYDTFNDEPVNYIPDYWQVIKGQCKVSAWDDNDKCLAFEDQNVDSNAMLHCFEKNVTVKSRFRPRLAQGAFWVAARYNLDNRFLIKAGYDVARGQWRIIEYWDGNSFIRASASEAITLNKWYDVRVVVRDMDVKLYVDGKFKCQAALATNANYGKVGIYVEKTKADADNFSYQGNGRVEDGVAFQYLTGVGSSDIMRLNNGNLIMECGGNKFYESNNNGLTWSTNTKFLASTDSWGAGNIFRLKSGKILHIFQIVVSPHPNWALRAGAEISTDEGTTWAGPYWIHPTAGNYCTMPGKITQVSNGRIFFPASTGGEGGAAENYGGMGVWYSDNDGLTWQESVNRLDLDTTGENLQEGKVVELSNGRLRLVCRSTKGYLCYSESMDNGVTWDTNIHQIYQLPSTLCAFNMVRDYTTSEIFVYWTYEDTNEYPSKAQLPRERVSLARSRDNMESWEFLMDIDDFEGHDMRYMNLNVFVDANYIIPTVMEWNTGLVPDGGSVLKVTRVERDKISAHKIFPPLH